MTEEPEQTKKTKGKGIVAGFRKLGYALIILFFVWLVMGQIIPRIFLPIGTPALRQDLTITPTDNQPLKRQSFHEILEDKDRQLTDLRTRMEQMEDRLKAAEEKARQPAQIDMAAIQSSLQAAEQQNNARIQEEQLQANNKLQAALHELQNEYGQKMAAANEKLASLQAKHDELAARPTESEQNRVRMASIETMIKQQNTLIETMKTEVASAQVQTVRQLSALASFVPMKEAILRGEPFDIPLAQMLNFTNGNRKVEALAGQLRPIAKDGVPSISALKTEFSGLLAKALASGGEAGSFTNNLRSLITIRKTGEQAGSTDEAILARAETRLAQDDLDSAIKEILTLSPAAANVMEGWTQKAKRNVLIRHIINDMQLALTQDVPAVQSSMPEREIAPVIPPSETKPAENMTPPPVAPAQPPVKPTAVPAAEKAKEKPAKPVVITKPAAKEKVAAKTPPKQKLEAETDNNDDGAQEQAPVKQPDKVQEKPKVQSASEPKPSYPGN